MLKIRFAFTEDHADIALKLATKICAMFPTFFDMKGPTLNGDIFHIYLNPRRKNKR